MNLHISLNQQHFDVEISLGEPGIIEVRFLKTGSDI